jgi:hypothetical protein
VTTVSNSGIDIGVGKRGGRKKGGGGGERERMTKKMEAIEDAGGKGGCFTKKISRYITIYIYKLFIYIYIYRCIDR